ncbi:KamA family radical SAM protein [Desulfurobacterium atlanticum]|uniref:L-lysine 2,3-aminomutase n=1 Tax=Desulfurobacterium atlanticum TaxID=240169 RepID=A0A238YM73_9BACT|nr:KamA family radical SAM protein [Desulfurobacterium atlanticum]SNR72092.1 L-lysine 2,3-aminomutase [Desulfurobacterium atlanticum]
MLGSPSDFLPFFSLNRKEIDDGERVCSEYPVRSTEYYASLADRNNPLDPIKRMVFPSLSELSQFVSEDPFKEEEQSPVPFLTHKYPDRVLVIITNYCPVLCRYCMRKRNWKRSTFVIGQKETDEIVNYVKEKRIRDVLISGGEPLSVDFQILEYLLLKLKEIDTVDVIRIGTKLPVVAPYLLTDRIVSLLEKAEKVWVNTHFNHPVEINNYSCEAVRKLLKAGVPVNNQTVLLKGVNDDAETLEKLFSLLQKIKVRPYYLFRCDPVKGVFHFATSVEKGLEIMRTLKKKLSPLALPYYAVDTFKGKVILFPEGAEYKKAKDGYLFNVNGTDIHLP